MKTYQAVTLVAVALALTGCQTTFGSKHGFFRNRELDYLHNPAIQRPPLKVPTGMESPKLNPLYTLPKGQDNFPSKESSNTLLPPGYHKVISTGKAKIIGKPHAAPTRHTRSASSWFSWLNPNAGKDQKLAKLNNQIAQLKDEMQTVKPGKIQTPSKTDVASSTHVSSSIAFDKNNAGLLTIDAPFNSAWDRIKTAISDTDYKIVRTDKGSGLLYIIPAAKPKAQKLMVYAYNAAGATKVSIFTHTGKLDTSTSAYSVLQQIKANLN